MPTSATPQGKKREGASGTAPHRLALAVQYAVTDATLPTRSALRRWATAAQEHDIAVVVRFVGTREAARLNAAFRGKADATNVLTFVYDDVLPLAGDIVLCAPLLRREARSQGKSLADHCAHLVVHGMLHLQRYDHDTERKARRMEARETAILRVFGIADPYVDPRSSLRPPPPKGACQCASDGRARTVVQAGKKGVRAADSTGHTVKRRAATRPG